MNWIIALGGILSPEPASLPIFEILGRRLTIRGYEHFEVTMDDTKLECAKRFVLDGLADGVLRLKVARTFPLDEIVEAHCFLESNAQVGNVVLTV